VHQALQAVRAYSQFAKVVRQLRKDKHYETDEKRKTVILTDDGVEKVEKILGIKNLYGSENIRNNLSPATSTPCSRFIPQR